MLLFNSFLQWHSFLQDGPQLVPITYIYQLTLPLERGQHIINAQAAGPKGTVFFWLNVNPLTYVASYELPNQSLALFNGDEQLTVFNITLHDELLPTLPTMSFTCAKDVSSSVITAVLRERGLRQWKFVCDTMTISNGLYQYACVAQEADALNQQIISLQTNYGSTASNIQALAPQLNQVDPFNLLAKTVYPQQFKNITTLALIGQLLTQASALGSIRNGCLYVFPMDVTAQIPSYYLQKFGPQTQWTRAAKVYDAVQASYALKQYPTPDTVLTVNDAASWIGSVSDTPCVDTTLLLPPSGAVSMLHCIGNVSIGGLSISLSALDKLMMNWNPVTATTVLVSLQQDASNKLEFTHYFNGQVGAGFILNIGSASTDTLVKNITLSPVQYVKTVAGNTTANCSYRVTLLDAGGTTLWQDVWRNTLSNTFETDIPENVSQVFQATTVRLEFTNLYPIGVDYGVQVIECDIQVQTQVQHTGSHVQTDSTLVWDQSWGGYQGGSWNGYLVVCSPPGPLSALLAGQTYQVVMDSLPSSSKLYPYLGNVQCRIEPQGARYAGAFDVLLCVNGCGNLSLTEQAHITLSVVETVQDWSWYPFYFMWSSSFNLFEAVDLPLSGFVRTGNPVTVTMIALSFVGDNYIDTLCLEADNPLTLTVMAGAGPRVYIEQTIFGSAEGARAYANGLLPVVSVAREQYTRDVPLSTDLSVGDTVNCDDVNMTVYAIDYRQDGKTIAAGRAMDTLMTRLQEQARRIDTLERKG